MNLFGFRLVRIIRNSMRPRLASGEYAAFGRIVKSIAHISEHTVRIEGLSPQSTSSKRLGEVKPDIILRRMITSIKSATRLKGARPKAAMDSSAIGRAMTR